MLGVRPVSLKSCDAEKELFVVVESETDSPHSNVALALSSVEYDMFAATLLLVLIMFCSLPVG